MLHLGARERIGNVAHHGRGLRVLSCAIAVAALAGAAGSPSAATAQAGLPLKRVASIPLPGASNRFDYISLDPKSNKLYIAHMNDDHIVVFDVRRRKVLKTIPAPGVHGVLAVPELERVFASATNVRQVFTIDERTDSVVARADGGEYPDGIAWDPDDRRAFVSDESGGVETVLSAAGRRIATVRLGGEAGNVQYDRRGRRILVAVQSQNVVAVIDPRVNRVVRRVELPGCDHDHGLLVDSPRRLAFVACDGNARLLTLDLVRLKVTGSATVGPSPDVLALDRSLHRLYVAAESGEVAVFAERGHGVTKLGQGLLAPAAHSVAVDARTHLVYFPLQSGDSGKPELRIMAPA